MARDYQGIRGRIPHIGPLTKVIALKLFLDIVPSSSTELLARCVDIFVVDLFMFQVISFRFKAEENLQRCGNVLFDILITEVSAFGMF